MKNRDLPVDLSSQREQSNNRQKLVDRPGWQESHGAAGPSLWMWCPAIPDQVRKKKRVGKRRSHGKSVRYRISGSKMFLPAYATFHFQEKGWKRFKASTWTILNMISSLISMDIYWYLLNHTKPIGSRSEGIDPQTSPGNLRFCHDPDTSWIYIYIHTYIYIYTNIYICIYMYTYICIHI